MKPTEFHDTLSKLLDAKLLPLVTKGVALNLVSCVEIYTTIFDTLVEVITEAKMEISNETVNYLAQQYYDGILVNGTYNLDPDIFTQRAKLSEIKSEELALLLTMLNGTDFTIPIVQELKNRS